MWTVQYSYRTSIYNPFGHFAYEYSSAVTNTRTRTGYPYLPVALSPIPAGLPPPFPGLWSHTGAAGLFQAVEILCCFRVFRTVRLLTCNLSHHPAYFLKISSCQQLPGCQLEQDEYEYTVQVGGSCSVFFSCGNTCCKIIVSYGTSTRIPI